MPALKTVWRYARWPLVVLLVAYVALVAYRIYDLAQADKTAEAVAKIHATRLTQDDVFGNLPAVPDDAANNATLAGVDVNHNGIRDDVEIAIYQAHKDSAKVSAAMLQYAKELQMEFTEVFNSPTLVAVIQEESRGYMCIPEDKEIREVENLMLNTDVRKNAREEIYKKYYTSYALPNSDYCDIDPSTFSN
jgi:hypothetical protein